jgi:CDP-paratose 2-epimerase
MKVLVTGGLGVIGSAVVSHYLAQGDQVTVIDAAEEPRNLWIEHRLRQSKKGMLLVYRERLETAFLDDLVAKMNCIVHAAAHTGIPHSSLDPTDDWVSNVDATRHLLEALRRNDAHVPTVLMSSVKPYFVPKDLTGPGVNELMPLIPDEPYAASKMAQSGLGMAYARAYDLPVTVLRFSNLYGPAPCHGPRHGWLTWFCISAAIGRPLEVQGGGQQRRDMLYATDVVQAIDKALFHMSTTRGEVFNVGGGPDRVVSVVQAATYIAKRTGIGIVNGPGRKNEDLIFYTDYRKFEKATGWEPGAGVYEGMDRVLAWAAENRVELKQLYEGVT